MKYIILILLTFFFSCTNKSNCFYILKKEQPIYLYSIDSVTRFTPTTIEVEQAYDIFIKNIPPNATRGNYMDCPIINNNLHNYCYQYLGYSNHQQERIIYINAFWNGSTLFYKQMKEEIDEGLIFVQDGYSHFWNAEINLNTQQIIQFAVNSIGG